MDINWDNFKVRCSAISKVMAESRDNPTITEKQLVRLAELEGKESLTDKLKVELAELNVKKENGNKVVLSAGAIEYLMEAYAWITEKMIPVGKEAMDLLQIKKGKESQTESIDMLSILDNAIYTENKEQVFNLFLTGEPDAYKGKSIWEAENVPDLKNLWDYPTFLKSINNGLENGYKNQIQGYGDITKSPRLEIVKCLVTNSQEIIGEMKFRVAKKFGAMTVESPDFLIEWEKWERSMIFDHIPLEKRVFRIPVEPFTAFEQQKVYDRVKICREWLAIFHENYQKLNR